MEIVAGHASLARRFEAAAVAIGNFDGVHRGHQRLLDETTATARARGATAVVLTFDPHPARFFDPTGAPRLLVTRARKLELLAAAGVDACVVETFDAAFAAMTPVEYVDRVLVGALGARDVHVGYDFTFGAKRAGNVDVLRRLGDERGFAVHVLAPVTVDGEVCSSTRVRKLLAEGDVAAAARLLGREHEVEGVVVAGAGRGRTIGVPTANLRPETEALPAPGVYAAWAESPGAPDRVGGRYVAAVNIGTNPTFGPGPQTVEAHLVDWTGPSLEGARLRLGFRRRLRDERRFPSPGALVDQIRHDIDAARRGG